MITFVTALYDIQRETNGDGRKFADYLNWLPLTLNCNCNYIIFTEEKVIPYIPKKNNIKIITTKLEEIPLFYLKDKINSILTNQEYKLKIQDNKRIECVLDLYNIIQYSKFEWLKKSIEFNPYESDYFFWIDAGCSRFFDDLQSSFPNLNKMPIKFLIQGNINTNKINIDEDYKWRSDCVLVGTFFGGSKNFVKSVSNEVLNFLYNEMLCKNMINNEQIALAFIKKNKPDLFDVYINLNGHHLPLLKYLQ